MADISNIDTETHHDIWDAFVNRGYFSTATTMPVTWDIGGKPQIIPVGTIMFSKNPRETTDPSQLGKYTVRDLIEVYKYVFSHPILLLTEREEDDKRYFYLPKADKIVIRATVIDRRPAVGAVETVHMPYLSTLYYAASIGAFAANPDAYMRPLAERYSKQFDGEDYQPPQEAKRSLFTRLAELINLQL